ncbi:MAG: VTT domain-containing protein [Clostridia bacterium]|nr:VTT domain-containing protein [Clostridia bacterium]
MKKNIVQGGLTAAIVLFILSLLFYIASHAQQLIGSVVAYLPQGSWRSALVLLVLYGIKGLVFVVPVPLLQFAASRLFTMPTAILVNLLGIVLCYLVPYATGFFFGERATRRFAHQYEKIAPFVERCHEHRFEIRFIPRLISFVPNDLLSVYLGAARIPLAVFLIASTLASAPKVVLNTLAGASIHDPTSPMFIISLLLSVALVAASLMLARKLNQRNKTHF